MLFCQDYEVCIKGMQIGCLVGINNNLLDFFHMRWHIYFYFSLFPLAGSSLTEGEESVYSYPNRNRNMEQWHFPLHFSSPAALREGAVFDWSGQINLKTRQGPQ